MQVQARTIQELHQDPDNSRKHDERNLQAIRESLEAFGQQKPIVIDQEGKVVAGNGTLEAARQLGWKEIQAVVTQLEGSNQTAFAIADNRTAELAAWDDVTLQDSLASLDDDMRQILHFTESELGAFNVDEVPFQELDDSDVKNFKGMTFQLHEDQVGIVEQALELAKGRGEGNSDLNENTAGNCIAAICREYLSA